jgi:hypothetical protein
MAVGKRLVHIDEIYKRRLLDESTPRRGDMAEIVRDHHRSETGLLVEVVNDPHHCENYCAECGQLVVGYFVEVVCNHPRFTAVPGPHFYPIEWLRRVNLSTVAH